MASHYSHRPVLLSESVACLDPRSDDVIVDGTVGGGGHAAAILERIGPHGCVVALDRDPAALEAARSHLAEYGERVRFVHASFRRLSAVLEELDVPRVDGVLLDLGVSSPQLDRAERGFAFAAEGAGTAPLDMRMDPTAGETAADLLARLSGEELEQSFRAFAELPGSRRLAAAIVDARAKAPLRTTSDLLAVIEGSGVGRGRRHHPATLVFQALRIAVNDELAALRDGIGAAIDALRPGRRVAVLAYHSLEDRIVKRTFRDEVRGCLCPPAQPVCTCGRQPRLELVTRRPLRPRDDEVASNRRARSARLRAAARLAEAS